MDRLEARVGAVNLDLGVSPNVAAPSIVVDAALSHFLSILGQLSTWWIPSESGPLPIPERPDKSYYSEFAQQFAKSYFNKNLLKCLIAIEILRYHIRGVRDFWDLGGGSGPFTAALFACQIAKRVSIVDYSESQLHLAQDILSGLDYSHDVSFKNHDIAEFDARGKCCVASYAFCEAMNHDIDIIEKIEQSKSFILIDSPPIVKGVAAYLSVRGIKTFGRKVEFSVSPELRSLVEGGGGRFSVMFKGEQQSLKGEGDGQFFQ